MAQRTIHDGAGAQDSSPRLTLADYQALAGFRYELRRLFAQSRKAAESAGLKPQQYQALLALRAHSGDHPMTVRDLAEELFIGASTAVELVDRLEARGLVSRATSSVDRRRVSLHLTPEAVDVLCALAAVHRDELGAHVPTLVALLERIGGRRDAEETR